MYIGGRWKGIDNIKKINGEIIKPNEIISEMPEEEAKLRKGFEPVYEGQKKEFKDIKEIKKSKEDNK